ncbi:carbohydrate-binding protein [Sunxiuqinia sp. A32]|uniref:carbohydrate-binding protein n=1 Tax=Sunxiuqinia sp. A32 TaxID=3461496 RepID=UPI0040452794
MKTTRQFFKSMVIGLFVLSPIFSSGQVLNERADSVYNAFNNAFILNDNNGNTFYKTALNNNNKDYFWQQALDIQSAEDNYFRTGSEEDKVLITKLLKTFNVQNTQDWLWNEYNDDIFWGDLAFLRGFEYTGDSSFLEQGIYAFDLAYYHTRNGGNWGWDDALGGGIWWSKRKEAKETLSNGPGIVAACYLYQFTGDSYYLIKAKEIYEWLRSTLRDENTGEVWNKINADGTVLKAVNIFNQGSFIGAANFLYQITGEGKYLADAKKTADRVITNQSNNGILASGQRGGTEMAEYFRWLGDFVRQNYLWNEYYSFLKLNADAAWSVRRRDLNITWNNFLQQMPEDDITGTNECNSAVVIHEVTPFLQSITDTIQAEDYNYKNGIYVDPIPSGGNCVDSIEAGDWMEYIVEIPTTGVYKLNYGVAAANEGSAFLLQNGLPIDTISFPVTGNLENYATVSSNVKLTAGIQSIKIVADNGGWNIDKWSAGITETSFPGKIQAEDYSDMSGIIVENTTDVGGGQNIGYIKYNDWLEYTIDVPKSGNYAINYRVAATQAGKILFQQNDETLAETTIPSTGGWQNWTTVGGTSVHLSEGTQTIKLYVQASGWNINWWSADLDSIPTISLTTPKVDTSYVFPATITIDADASDADGSISKVDFYQGTTLIGTDNSSPYRLILDNVQKGEYTFWARATDNIGNTASTEDVNVTVSNILPVVSLTSPAIDTTLQDTEVNFTLEADATDEDGSIYKVEFYNGTTLLGTDYFAPYSYDWTGITPGTYWVTAKATDSSREATTTGEVKITVSTPTGVDELQITSTMRIYPNPVTTYLTIDCGKQRFENIMIFDNAGKVVLEKSGNYQGSASINVENLPSGIYFVSVQTADNGRLAKKFLK